MLKQGYRLFYPSGNFVFIRIIRQATAARTTSAVKVANYHVVEQNIVQPPGRHVR